MNILTKYRLGTGLALASIGLIAIALVWATMELEDAARQRRQTTEIVQRYSELRLVSFDYASSRQERARLQWHAVSKRIDALLAAHQFREPEHVAVLADLRARSSAAPQLFAELGATRDDDFPSAAVRQRFEAQLLSRLLLDQQDSLADALRLTELVNARIELTQRRVAYATLAGLGLIALVLGGFAWLLRRQVLDPIIRLQHATHEIAAGNLNLRIGPAGNDEISALAKDFDAMTQSLRESFNEIELSNRNLTVANKELEAFDYSVSHDLRAPLRSMDGYSLALLEDYGDKLDEEGKDALERIRAASRRMGDLIDDLMKLSRVTSEALERTPLDLSAMARGIVAEIECEAPERRVEWLVEPGLTLDADTALMRIALFNLLQNAWKFTARTPQPVIRVGARHGESGTEYFVADNGAGFDMAYAERLFGPFQRLHSVEEFPGTGIGLAIVQRIIFRHGGDIRAEAGKGQGASFLFSVKEPKNGRAGKTA